MTFSTLPPAVELARPLVEIRGDEMARVMWDLVRERIIAPHVRLRLETFDLALGERDRTRDRVTRDAAEALAEFGAGTKCATITPDAARVASAGLRQAWPSPNGTIRRRLRGVIFREPIVIPTVPRLVPGWVRPIVVARHAHGDQYQASDFVVPGPGRLTITYRPTDDGDPIEREVTTFGPDGGVALAMFNFAASIAEFARACFSYGLDRGFPVYLTTKDTVLRAYDGMFRDTFQRVYEEEFADRFAAASLHYEHRLIDDMVAAALKMPGGYVWACKNYDGDVHSDVVAQGFGSPGLMTSMLTSPDGGVLLTEAAHGTVARHYRRREAGEEPSTNPVATVFAWTRALAHRGRLDATPGVVAFAELVERAVLRTVESGRMTRDLAMLMDGGQEHLGTEDFVDAVAAEVAADLAAGTAPLSGAGRAGGADPGV
ncbi:NADP-dependent isocitrate dehydrogenase [Rhizomonospora bruguierae]|uniref:NADP-dependent isocitrate dehydrogenase n=1 Tax=Rhizomonospora bruguierae TaxID=1581705 RepID=UPI001BCB02D0|nr:NADP-dependent isocitrate dehydrogenase [Micromonospora sp. NBRC 107566]